VLSFLSIIISWRYEDLSIKCQNGIKKLTETVNFPKQGTSTDHKVIYGTLHERTEEKSITAQASRWETCFCPLVTHPHDLDMNFATGAMQLAFPNNREKSFVHSSKAEMLRFHTNRSKKALLSWYRRLEELIVFKHIHGHYNVPQKCTLFPKLGSWVNKQRYTRQKLSIEKVRALDAIGFDWGKQIGDSAWRLRFQSLLEFKERYGNCKSCKMILIG
jgi:hypothetical protein